MAREFACLASSARCRGASGTRLNQCQGDPSAGRECYDYCTAATGCNPASGELLGQCLIACGEGFTGAERLVFEESIQCFEREQPQACEARAACIPEATEASCEPWCTALATCELNDGCENTCDGDDLSGLRTVQQGVCLDEAGEVCDDVNACLLTSLPEAPEPVAIDVLCRDYAACGLDEIIPCEFLADFAEAEGPGFLNCVAENLNPCPRDPFFAFEACLGGGAAPRPDFEPVCRQLCDTQAQCDELADGNARECTAQCLDAVEAGEDLGVQLLECRDALSCNALRECRQAVFGDACDGPCNQYLECGGQAFEDLAACREECNRQRLQPLAGANYTDRVQACLTALEDDAEQPELCAEQGESCFTPGFVVGVATCEELCPQLLECGGGVIVGDLQECIDGCRGADVEDPERNLELRACLTETLAAGICDEDVFFRCLEGPGPPPPLP